MSTVNATGKIENGIPLSVRAGDLIVQHDKAGWSAIKIIAVDVWPDGTLTAHCLTFESSLAKPTVDSLKQAPVRIWHAPIDAGSFGKGWELLGNVAPSEKETVGFIQYLKLTDFPRYLQTTGQDSRKVVRAANEHYARANALDNQGKRQEAIDEYTKAINILPLFFEAIDNRAFTYMDLGKLREALQDFEESLRVNPNGMAAFFSRGECLMKLGNLKVAEAVFLEGQTRFPEKRDMFTKFLNATRALQTKSCYERLLLRGE
jgi:tetratricopeptide (TPR) repeat protein